VRREIAFDVRFRVPQRHTVLLEKSVNLEPRLKGEQAPDLVLRQRTSSIGLDRKRFKGLPRDIRQSARLQPRRLMITSAAVCCKPC
jgi:hypothetical protein